MNSNVDLALDAFCAGYRVLSYKKGDIVIRGDDDPTGVYFIKGGSVKMSSINEEGEELSVNIYKPGTFFPMAWAIGGIPNTYNYQTLSEAKLVRVPKEEFLGFLQKNPAVLYDLTRRILIGLDGLIFNMRNLLGAKSEGKIAVILYTLARRFGVPKGTQLEIGVALTHQDIARFAGLTRETTTIAINNLIKRDIVAQNKRRLIIKDLEALRNSF
jgi:CRP/FNR family transcriptional regulator